MSAPEPRDLGLITPKSVVRLITIKPSIKEFFVRVWDKVLFAVEKLDDFCQQAHGAPGWLTVPEATPQDLAFEMLKKCARQRYYVVTNRDDDLLWVGCFFDLHLQIALSSRVPIMSVKWVDAARFIHRQDSLLRAMHGVEPIFSDKDAVEVTTDFGPCKLSWHAVNSFWKRVKGCWLVRSGKWKYDSHMKRNALFLLIDLLRASQSVERENRLMQMLKHGCRPADYRTWSGWILVIADGVLITCYEKGSIADSGYSFNPPEAATGGNPRKTSDRRELWFRKKGRKKTQIKE